MHNPERAKYPSLTLVEVLQNLLKTKQGDKEELLEYLSWFKSKRDIIYCLLRKGFLDYYAKNTQEYTNPMSDDIRTKIKRNDGINLFQAHTSPTAITELFTYYYRTFTKTTSGSVCLSPSQCLMACK